MSELMFYRQKRQDGGVRTAVASDEETLLHAFQPGRGESDPALLWFVDLRCRGPRLPADPEKARAWLLEHSAVIKDGFSQLAEKLRVGLDYEAWPLMWKVPRSPRGVQMTIVCSIVGRMTRLDVASILTDIRDHWEETLRRLPVVQPTAS